MSAHERPHRSQARGWLFLAPDEVPVPWRDRAISMVLVPLLPEEAAGILAEGTATGHSDEDRLLTLVAEGRSIRQMAKDLGLSARGVQHRLAKLRRRFDVASTVELACLLAERGFAHGTHRKRDATGGRGADIEETP